MAMIDLFEDTLRDVQNKPGSYTEVKPYFIFKYYFDKGNRPPYNFPDLVQQIATRFELGYNISYKGDSFCPVRSRVFFYPKKGFESELNEVANF